MRTRSLAVAAIVLIVLLVPGRANAFGVNDVLKLERQRAPDSLIVQKIERTHHAIRVRARDFRRLEQAGASDRVMSALADTEHAPQGSRLFVAPPVYVHYPFDPLPYQDFGGYAIGFTFRPRDW